MASAVVRRDMGNAGAKRHTWFRNTMTAPVRKTKRLSRELADLKPWSGWKVANGDNAAEDESVDEQDEQQPRSSGEVEISPIKLEAPAEQPEIQPTPESEAADLVIGTHEAREKTPHATESAQSVDNRAALAGPRCPLCICPINGVLFPVIHCEDCNRIYHLKCIAFEMDPTYHPFHGSSIPKADLCTACGCPAGNDLGVYCGHPGILFHRRDQDPDFKEYFEKGCLQQAEYEDLV